jgi:tetratricopeptide (TPR) repeat protein
MSYRISSVFCIAFFMAINSLIALNGQSADSLIYLLNHNLVKDDSEKYTLLCRIATNSTDSDLKIEYSDQAIKLAEKLNISPADPYVFKGIGYLDNGNLVSALDCFIKAANYYKNDNSNIGLARTYLYIAETYNQQENHDNEKIYLKNAIDIFRKEKDSISLAVALTNLGYACYGMEQYDTALTIFSTTGEIFNKLGSSTNYAYCLGNSGLAYSRLSEFDLAEEYLLRAIEILNKQDDKRAVTEFMIEYASVLQHKGEIKKAIECATTGFENSIKNGFKEYERNAANRLASLYEASGRFDSAFHYQSIYIRANDSIKSEENIQKMADLRTEFEVSKKQAEVEVLEKNKIIQRIVIFGMAIILLLAIGLIVLYYYSLKRTRKLMAELDERNILLEEQRAELIEHNDKIIKANEELKQLYEITSSQKEEIISSINYAQRIQAAILPPETYINELINENFVFYRPKEIVSGDFYWIKQINQYVVLVSADCTGHGVPGAFMSMLGISYLNEIVQRKGVTLANQILNELRKEIKHALRQTGKKEESRDGMDMAVCVIDTKNSTMQYSGAYCP